MICFWLGFISCDVKNNVCDLVRCVVFQTREYMQPLCKKNGGTKRGCGWRLSFVLIEFLKRDFVRGILLGWISTPTYKAGVGAETAGIVANFEKCVLLSTLME